MEKHFKPKITLFYCINAFNESDAPTLTGEDEFQVTAKRLPCSSMVKDVFLLRAFETGSDGAAGASDT